jgi:radical SAM-linked protein
MSERALSRMRIHFAVEEPVKYISHLDLLRAWERILRRAGVPVAYSQGYNPHPRIVIAMPLPVGCTGEAEVLDVLLEEALAPADLLSAVEPTLPIGISARSAETVALKGPALPSQIAYAVYEIALVGVGHAGAQRRAADLMQRDALEVEFRRKRFDLRPLIGALTAYMDRGQVSLEAKLLCDTTGRIGRPDVLLDALDLTPYARAVHRVQIAFRAPE